MSSSHTTAASAKSHKRKLHRPMRARSPHEKHRVSTPLELFFDLIFVVAISLNAAGLHHGIVEGHASGAVLSFLMQFVVIFWAWLGFTWFASGFDADDVPYRVLVFVQMAGALVIAAGIPAGFERFDFQTITIGYTIMRLGLVALWYRAGCANPAFKNVAQRAVTGIVALQLLWIASLWLPASYRLPTFFVLMFLELLVPVWAQQKIQIPWHPEHIHERYSLFNIIVLGESILATVNALKNTMANGRLDAATLVVVLCAMVIMFSLWWMYFDKPKTNLETGKISTGLWWGYGHYWVFASAAAMGVGLTIAVEATVGSFKSPQVHAQWAIAIPVASYILSLWMVHFTALNHSLVGKIGFPLVVALVLSTAFLPNIVASMVAIAVLCCGFLTMMLLLYYHANPERHAYFDTAHSKI